MEVEYVPERAKISVDIFGLDEHDAEVCVESIMTRLGRLKFRKTCDYLISQEREGTLYP